MPVTITRRTRGGFAVAAVVALALSACSPSNGSDEPRTSSSGSPSAGSSSAVAGGSASASASKSASPTPIPASSQGPAKNWPVPKMPEEGKKKSLEGAAAFAEYYFALIEYTSTTTETGPIKKVSLSSCTACQKDVIATSDYNKKNHAWNAGGAYHPTITAAKKSKSDATIVAFKYDQDKRVVYDHKGTINAVYEPTQKPVYGTFRLLWKDGWKVQSIDLVKQ